MASIGKDKGGRKRVLFVAEDGSRKTVRLGKCSLRQAQAFKVRLEALIAGRFSGIDAETARWAGDLPDDMHAKLASLGLVDPRAATRSATLGELLDRYFAARTDVKPGTVLVWQQAKQSLLDYFGADRPIREIHEGDAELWRLSMAQQGLAEPTIRKRCGNAKQFMAFAIRQRFVSSNPFTGLKSSAKGNDSRLHFVSGADIERVIDAAPDTEWRLIFALCRYAGLRCPSEILALQWADVNWADNRMLVHSPKTERHEGGESRLVPIFGELRPYLLAAFDEAEPGATYCIARHRIASANFRTTGHKIIHRAGLKPWPRTFQNLRASRETELTQSFPLHVVTSWLGNTQPVALRHYLSVRDEDFDRAAQNPAQLAHKTAQYTAAQYGTEQKPTPKESPENADMLVDASACGTTRQFPLAPRGFEPLLPG